MHRDKTGRPAVDVLEARRLLAWGEADQGFGDDGVVLLDENVVDAVHLTPNGVIASGAWGSRPRVVALDTAGEIDTDFGNAGTATGDVRPARLGRFQQDDGKIIVAGFAVDSYDEMLLRLNADGTVDRSFGDNGLAASGFREGSVFSFAQQPDGKLLIAGLYREDAGSGDTHAIVRMLPDGSLDPTFGDNGVADQLNTLATGFLSSAPSILRLEDMNIGVMPDGRITVSANMIAGLLGSRVPILFRLNADGSTDTSLDFYGARIFNPHQGRETIQTLAVDSAGRLLLGGTYESRFAVWRLDASLRPDPTFSGDGRLDRFGDYYSSVNAVRELNGGDIIVAGYGTLGGVVGKALLATAVTSDGGYVEAFGGGSDTIFDAGLGLSSLHADIDADGRIAMEVLHSDSARWGVALFEGRTPSTPPQPPTPPPTADTLDLTALTPTSSVNGWGPYELNQSNGEKPAGDGRTLTIQGQTFAKGFGVHANSRLTFDVPAGYQRFTAFAGVDDEVGSRGSVVFRVLGDGRLLYESGVRRGTDAALPIDVNIAGVDTLVLEVTPANDGPAYDHANWATPTLIQGAGNPTPPPTTPPSPPGGNGDLIFGEDFSDELDGAITGQADHFDGYRDWYADGGGVSDDRYLITGRANVEWRTEPFVLEYGKLDVGMDLVSGGSLDSGGQYVDSLVVRIVGESYTRVLYQTRGHVDARQTSIDLEALDVPNDQVLQLVITADVTGGDEFYAFDNIVMSRSGGGATTPPTPPTPPVGGTTYLSDLNPTSAVNGYGSFERDQSNGERASGDGATLTLNGETYAKGLGVHANSDIVFDIASLGATRFLSDIGIDDYVGNRGSVIFRVYGDGNLLYDSGRMTGASATKSVDVSIAGMSELRLVVNGSDMGTSFDHADWAGARLV